jgi:hypothetical protein
MDIQSLIVEYTRGKLDATRISDKDIQKIIKQLEKQMQIIAICTHSDSIPQAKTMKNILLILTTELKRRLS